MSFPGATTARADAAYVLVGAPLDVSTSFRPGARFGPERIRQFARQFEDFDQRTGLHFSECGVHDHGDVRAWHDVPEYLAFLEGTCADARHDGALPLLLGGEHTVSLAGIRAAEPDVVVSLDAHLDLRNDLDDNPLSHACVLRRALEEGAADEAVVLGARAGSEAEWERAEADDVTVVPPEAVSEWSAADAGLADRSVYLTLDVDVLDPAYAPGTGTPEPFGLEPGVVRDVVREVAPEIDAADVVEVNDRDDGQAATVAAKLLRAIVYEHAGAAPVASGE